MVPKRRRRSATPTKDRVKNKPAAAVSANIDSGVNHANFKNINPIKKGANDLRPFLVEDTFVDAIYKPRTITALLILVSFVIYQAFYKEGSVASGLAVAASVFLAYCAVQVRDGLMSRPHPVVWRVVHGLGILCKIIRTISYRYSSHHVICCYRHVYVIVPLNAKSY